MKKKTGLIIGRKRKIILVCFVVLSFSMLLGVFVTDINNQYSRPSPVLEEMPDNCYDRTLLVVADQDFFPYSYYDKKGQICGYDVELITIIANRLHMNLDIRLLTRDSIYKRINDSLADVVLSCDYSSSNINEINLLKTQPVELCEFAAFGKKPIHSFSDLYGKRLAYHNDGNVRDLMDKFHLLPNAYVYASNQQAFEAVKDDECEYVIIRLPVGSNINKNTEYGNIKPYVHLGSSEMCFGIPQEKEELRDKIDECIFQLENEGKLSYLNEKWIVLNRYSISFTEFVNQNSWIAIFPSMILIIALIAVLLESDNTKLYQKKDKIIHELVKKYELVFSVDCNSEQVNVYSDMSFSSLFINPTPDSKYSDWIKENIQKIIYLKDYEYVLKELSKENLIKRFLNEDYYVITFRVNSKKDFLYYKAEISLFTDSFGKQEFLFCFKSNDSDTRESIHHAEELEQALKLAQAGNDAKNRFLFNISHDIRTPLNILQGYTEIVEHNIGDRKTIEDAIYKIKQASVYLNQFMNDVLDITKIETGKLLLNLSAEDIIETESKLCELMTLELEQKKLTFITDFSGIKDRYVWRDGLRVSRVMSNMINNAIKYTPSGGVIEYSIKQIPCEKEGYGSYVFAVKDNGCGMSREFVEHIFEMFERDESSLVNRYQGAGLGMSVVKRLVDLLQGKIDVESELNVGTTVRIQLDFKLSSEEEVQEKKIRYEKAGINLENMSILVVEDNECNREIVRLLLEDAGVFVEEACDGREALEKLTTAESGLFDAILMDIQMPFMNGYEAAKSIRNLENKDVAEIPIIALSANAFDDDMKKAFECGMNDFLSKPLDVKKLIETLGKFWKSEN